MQRRRFNKIEEGSIGSILVTMNRSRDSRLPKFSTSVFDFPRGIHLAFPKHCFYPLQALTLLSLHTSRLQGSVADKRRPRRKGHREKKKTTKKKKKRKVRRRESWVQRDRGKERTQRQKCGPVEPCP